MSPAYGSKHPLRQPQLLGAKPLNPSGRRDVRLAKFAFQKPADPQSTHLLPFERVQILNPERQRSGKSMVFGKSAFGAFQTGDNWAACGLSAHRQSLMTNGH